MKFLILSTQYGAWCELEYGSCVAREIAEILKELGHHVRIVMKPKPEDANKAINEFAPDVVWFVGHGNTFITTLERLTHWIVDKTHCGGREDKNLNILKGKIANALSCLTAACLGKILTKYYGCNYYLGYEKEFWFLWCGCVGPDGFGCACGRWNPLPGAVRDFVNRFAVICMHESNLYFLVGLALGFTPEQAHGYSLKRFDQWIKYWKNFKFKTGVERNLAALTLRLLKIDRDIQRLCKNGEYVKPEEPPTDPPEITEYAAVQVLSEPSGANIYVNGELQGTTPITLKLKAGEYTIRCELSGYKPVERKIRVKEARTYIIKFVLKEEEISPVKMMAIPLTLVGLGYIMAMLKRLSR